jgi:DNA-binding NarL/FixJ family response regulator
VDDSARFADAAEELLRAQGMDVVGQADSGSQAMRQLAALRPDVVLVDIDLGGESGFDLARRISEAAPGAGVSVVLVSSHDESEFAELIAESPACGFVSKSELSAAAIAQLTGL